MVTVTFKAFVAALILATLEGLVTVALFKTAGSAVPGLINFFTRLVGVYFLVALLLSLAAATLLKRLGAKLMQASGAALLSAVIGAILTALSIHALHNFSLKGQHRQFPERLDLIMENVDLLNREQRHTLLQDMLLWPFHPLRPLEVSPPGFSRRGEEVQFAPRAT